MSSRKPFDRRALFASGAAAAFLAATGAGAGPLPQRGGALRLALSGAARSDDWLRGDGLFMQIARQGLVYETLTEVAADGTLRPELATGWHSSADARVWTFDLRKDVIFHDGTAFTARDAAHSLAALGEVHVLTPARIAVTLAAPDRVLPFTLAQPAHVIRPAHASAAGIGTGLYAVRHFAAGQQLVTARVAAHWKDGQAGWFDGVTLSSIPSGAVRAQAVAEYLVDGADLTDTDALAAFDDIVRWEGHAVARSVAMPAALGPRPIDDLRAPQRWWGA